MARTNFDRFTENAEYLCSNPECQTDGYMSISYPSDMLHFHKGGWYCDYCFDFDFTSSITNRGRSLESEIRLGRERGICHRTLPQPITEFLEE